MLTAIDDHHWLFVVWRASSALVSVTLRLPLLTGTRLKSLVLCASVFEGILESLGVAGVRSRKVDSLGLGLGIDPRLHHRA